MQKKALFVIFIIVFVSLFGFGVILPLLPFIAETYGANALEIGLLASTYSLAQFVGAPVLGQLSDRYGRKKLLIISQIGSFIGFVLLALSGNLFLIFLSRLIDGITGGNISIAQAYIADVTDEKNRVKGMGIVGAAFGLGFIFGPALGGILFKYGFWVPAIFAALINLITIFMTKFFLKETVKEHEFPLAKIVHKKKGLSSIFSISDVIKIIKHKYFGYFILTFFAINVVFSLFEGLFALWTHDSFSYGPTENGYLFALAGVLAVACQLVFLPLLSKRISEKNILLLSLPFVGIGLLFLAIAQNTNHLYLGISILVASNSFIVPTIQSLASKSVKKGDYGEALGALQSFGSLGRIFGPAIGGELYYTHGKDIPFYFAATGVIPIAVIMFKVLNGKKIS